MRFRKPIALIALLLLPLMWRGAHAAELRDLRVWDGPEATRVVFDLSGPAEHRLFKLEAPDRIVIDLSGVSDGAQAIPQQDGSGVIKRIRSARQPDGALRIVLDVSNAVTARSFALTPNTEYGYRVVVDLSGGTAAAAAPATPAAAPAATPARPQPAQPPTALESKPIIVAIDAGHGGQDPGARGASGLLEKDVALAISRELQRLIDAEPGFKAVMIRDGDYFIALRDRVDRARQAQADLFVSVHANAYTDRRVRGSSVYALSRGGATSEQARWLARRENAADLIGGVELAEKDDVLAKVLFDISQTAAIEASLDLGHRVLSSMGTANRLQKAEVQQAGFMVLKAPDIPSILVETAFITNAEEERMLGDPRQQRRLARSIFDGVKGYFENYRPLRYVERNGEPRNHTVRRGETLSELANQYRVSLSDLKSVNGLTSDRLRVGEVLQIP
jgi:N-acetylmuramoyl-L-alanine amidase